MTGILRRPDFWIGVVTGAVIVPWGLKRFAPTVHIPGVQ